MFQNILAFLGRHLANYLTKPIKNYKPVFVYTGDQLLNILMPGDVLLVEGNLRIITAIKYLTQSTWSHAAIFIGNQLNQFDHGESINLIEADVAKGVIAIPLSKYSCYHTRICRPVGLVDDDKNKVVEYVVSRIGDTYDLKNILI